MKYIFMTNTEGERIACSACAFEAPLREFTVGVLRDARKERLCELCAGSYISDAYVHPNQQHAAKVILAIGYVGNAILAELGRFKDAETIILPPDSEDLPE